MKWLIYLSLGLFVYDVWAINQNLKNGSDGYITLFLIPAFLLLLYTFFSVRYVIKNNIIDISISKWILILLPAFSYIVAHLVIFCFMVLQLTTPKPY